VSNILFPPANDGLEMRQNVIKFQSGMSWITLIERLGTEAQCEAAVAPGI